MIKLSNAEAQIKDLELQLDDALGVKEMLVQLTEHNLMLGEVSQVYTWYIHSRIVLMLYSFKKIEEMRWRP